MGSLIVPWGVGSGSISLTYSGNRNGNITVSSSSNDAPVSRSKTVTVSTTKGTPRKSKTISINQDVSPNILPTLRASNVGLLYNNGTVKSNLTTYRYSDYIEIPKNINGVYCHSVFPYKTYSGLCVYDANKNFIGNGDNLDFLANSRDRENGVTYFGDYPNAKFIRFSPGENLQSTCYLEWVNISLYQKIQYYRASNVGILKEDGTVRTDLTGFRYSDYISIPTNATIISAVRVFPNASPWSGMQIFNSNKTFIGNGENLGNYSGVAKGETTLSNFSGAKYIRFCRDINQSLPCYIVFANYSFL